MVKQRALLASCRSTCHSISAESLILAITPYIISQGSLTLTSEVLLVRVTINRSGSPYSRIKGFRYILLVALSAGVTKAIRQEFSRIISPVEVRNSIPEPEVKKETDPDDALRELLNSPIFDG